MHDMPVDGVIDQPVIIGAHGDQKGWPHGLFRPSPSIINRANMNMYGGLCALWLVRDATAARLLAMRQWREHGEIARELLKEANRFSDSDGIAILTAAY
eukprot:scaffold6021_cov117-Isochrysis_galbana.AAC.5